MNKSQNSSDKINKLKIVPPTPKILFEYPEIDEYFRKIRTLFFKIKSKNFLNDILNDEEKNKENLYSKIFDFHKVIRVVKFKNSERVEFQIFSFVENKFKELPIYKFFEFFHGLTQYYILPFPKNNIVDIFSFILKDSVNEIIPIPELSKIIQNHNIKINTTIIDKLTTSNNSSSNNSSKELQTKTLRTNLNFYLGGCEFAILKMFSGNKIDKIKINKKFTKEIWGMFDNDVRYFALKIFKNKKIYLKNVIWLTQNIVALNSLKNTNPEIIDNLYLYFADKFAIDQEIKDLVLNNKIIDKILDLYFDNIEIKQDIKIIPSWARSSLSLNLCDNHNSQSSDFHVKVNYFKSLPNIKQSFTQDNQLEDPFSLNNTYQNNLNNTYQNNIESETIIPEDIINEKYFKSFNFLFFVKYLEQKNINNNLKYFWVKNYKYFSNIYNNLFLIISKHLNSPPANSATLKNYISINDKNKFVHLDNHAKIEICKIIDYYIDSLTDLRLLKNEEFVESFRLSISSASSIHSFCETFKDIINNASNPQNKNFSTGFWDFDNSIFKISYNKNELLKISKSSQKPTKNIKKFKSLKFKSLNQKSLKQNIEAQTQNTIQKIKFKKYI